MYVLALTLFTILLMSLNSAVFHREANTELDGSGEVLLVCAGQWPRGFVRAQASPRDGSAGAAGCCWTDTAGQGRASSPL